MSASERIKQALNTITISKILYGSSSHLATLLISLIVTLATMYFSGIGPFAPPGAEISYEVGNTLSQPNGSFLLPIYFRNSGSEDIGSFSIVYFFKSYINGVLDNDFSILGRFANASPYIAKNKDSEYKIEGNIITIRYSSLPKNDNFVEQIYINKIYGVKVIQQNTSAKVEPEMGLYYM